MNTVSAMRMIPTSAEIIADSIIEAWVDMFGNPSLIKTPNDEYTKDIANKLANAMLDIFYAKYGNGVPENELENILSKKLLEKFK